MDEYDEEMSPEMAKKKWSPGHLYILDYGDSRQYKIGITSGNPVNRVNQITRGSGQLLPNPIESKLVVSLEMSTNPYYLEQLLHMDRSAYHLGGEWFEFESAEELTWIVSMIEPFGNLTYYPAWYEKFESDSLMYILSDIFDVNLDYYKDFKVEFFHGVYRVRLKDDNKDGLRELERIYRKAKIENPGSFDDQIVVFDYTTWDEKIKRSNMNKKLTL